MRGKEWWAVFLLLLVGCGSTPVREPLPDNVYCRGSAAEMSDQWHGLLDKLFTMKRFWESRAQAETELAALFACLEAIRE